MKKIKSRFIMVVVFLFMLAFVPAIKSEAANLNKPGDIKYVAQQKGKIGLTWNFDPGLWTYLDAGYDVGYEVQFRTSKNKNIKTYNSSTDQNCFLFDSTTSIFGFVASNSKFKAAPFKVRIRSFIYDEQTQTYEYSDYSSEKVIVPRAVIKKPKVTGEGKVKVTWKKVSGAKSYTIYLSSNEGKKYKKVATTTKCSTTLKNLKKYNNYYVYVQANKVKVGKKKYNSTKPTNNASNVYSFYIYTKQQ
jgi:hypothetical protein